MTEKRFQPEKQVLSSNYSGISCITWCKMLWFALTVFLLFIIMQYTILQIRKQLLF